MKNENGITLIALIITIIVMLILVAVTINIAINGELFDTARNASEGMQKASDIESLQAAALGAYDAVTGEIDFTKLDANLPDGFTGTNGTYTKDEKTYIVDKKTAEVEENDVIDTSPTGTYTNLFILLGDTDRSIEFQRVQIDENGTGTVNESVAFNWEYSEEDLSIINFTVPLYSLNFSGEFTKKGTNKIITTKNTHGQDEVLITEGFEGLIPLTGTYTNAKDFEGVVRMTFTKETIDGVTYGIAEVYQYDGLTRKLRYALIENTIYFNPQRNDEIYTINNEYTQITLSGGYVFNKE